MTLGIGRELDVSERFESKHSIGAQLKQDDHPGEHLYAGKRMPTLDTRVELAGKAEALCGVFLRPLFGSPGLAHRSANRIHQGRALRKMRQRAPTVGSRSRVHDVTLRGRS